MTDPCPRCNTLQTQLDLARADLQAERDRYERLVERMADLQRAGFSTPQPASTAPTPGKRLPATVLAAISAHMHPKGAAWRDTAKTARQWLDEEVPEAEVVRRIHLGGAWIHEPEPEPLPAA